MTECDRQRKVLDKQQNHWNQVYSEDPEFFGAEHSFSAQRAVDVFKTEGTRKILELGAGQGRDSLFFAKNGFQIHAVDYSENAVKVIREKSQSMGMAGLVNAVCHDIRKPLPFKDEAFDACYCNMLFCMALCERELESLFREIRRVLKPSGLSVFTVRNTSDPHFGKGIHRGESMYEFGGFIVHFFNKAKTEHLAKGYEILLLDEFEEGELPRRLYFVMLRKENSINELFSRQRIVET